MASIKKLEMAAALSENNYIQIQKGLFGLKQTAYSIDTRSEIDCFVFDYSPSEGDRNCRPDISLRRLILAIIVWSVV